MFKVSRLIGKAQVISNLKKLAYNVPAQIGLALRQETEIEATEVKRRCPVKTGLLRSTIHVEGPFRSGRRVWCYIVAGGLEAPYAVYVEFDLEAIHPTGQALYMTSVFMESKSYMGARTAERMRQNKALMVAMS